MKGDERIMTDNCFSLGLVVIQTLSFVMNVVDHRFSHELHYVRSSKVNLSPSKLCSSGVV